MSAYPHILKVGTQAAYNALETKDSNVLYFCSDTAKIYKGSTDYTSTIIIASSKPTTPITGKVYVFTNTDTVESYINNTWKILSYPVATTINAASDDNHVATAKAVYDSIQEAIADFIESENTITAVTTCTVNGKINVSKGDGTNADIAVHGVVTTPQWNSTTRVLTLPISDGDSIEVNIGKDIFVDPSAENKYNPATGNIEIYLNDGTGPTSTKIEIPADSLIKQYTDVDSQTANVTINNTNNTISVDVIVDPVNGNGLVATANGLKVDLSAYAKTATITSITDALDTRLDAAEATINTLDGAIDILNGDANTDGSVAKQIASAVAPLVTSSTDLDARVDDLESGLIIATSWGTF